MRNSRKTSCYRRAFEGGSCLLGSRVGEEIFRVTVYPTGEFVIKSIYLLKDSGKCSGINLQTQKKTSSRTCADMGGLLKYCLHSDICEGKSLEHSGILISFFHGMVIDMTVRLRQQNTPSIHSCDLIIQAIQPLHKYCCSEKDLYHFFSCPSGCQGFSVIFAKRCQI